MNDSVDLQQEPWQGAAGEPQQAKLGRVILAITVVRGVLAVLLALALIANPHQFRPMLRNFMGLFLLSLLDAIERVTARSSTADQRAELLRQVRLVEAESQAGSSIAWDQERVGRRCAELAAMLSNRTSEAITDGKPEVLEPDSPARRRSDHSSGSGC